MNILIKDTNIEDLQRAMLMFSGHEILELHDHGDLIDKNRMIDILHHGSKCVSEIQKGAKDEESISYCQGVMVGYTNSIVALDGAPVVIPAERSEG